MKLPSFTSMFITSGAVALVACAVVFYIYNSKLILQDSHMTSALQKICASGSEDLLITTHMDGDGKVGGYSAFVSGMLDGPGWLYDTEGNMLWHGAVRSVDFRDRYDKLTLDYPLQQEASCVKKQLNTTNMHQDYTLFSGVPGRDVVAAGDTGFFMPNDDDVIIAEKLIKTKLPKLDSYYRQYYGVRDKDGHRTLILRAVAKNLASEFPDWRSKPIFVFDGGDGFIDGAVNLTTKTLLYAEYHGEG